MRINHLQQLCVHGAGGAVSRSRTSEMGMMGKLLRGAWPLNGFLVTRVCAAALDRVPLAGGIAGLGARFGSAVQDAARSPHSIGHAAARRCGSRRMRALRRRSCISLLATAQADHLNPSATMRGPRASGR